MPAVLCRSIFLVSLLGLVAPANAACPARPADDYEKIYCEIKAKGGGATLPSFEDFRRNEPQVQALLLKRPAQRLGIEIPKPVANAVTPTANNDEHRSQPEPETAVPETSPTPTGMDNCALKGKVILCSGRTYRLATNQPNSALGEGVLGESNTLGLENFSGDLNDEAAVRRYLSNAYDRYIAKMLEIGLGGATMSFTRFYNSFYRHEAEGIDFAERMESTFNYLKQDKQNLSVSGRLTDELPKRIQECTWAGRAVIVCDDVATNWVYLRAD